MSPEGTHTAIAGIVVHESVKQFDNTGLMSCQPAYPAPHEAAHTLNQATDIH